LTQTFWLKVCFIKFFLHYFFVAGVVTSFFAGLTPLLRVLTPPCRDWLTPPKAERPCARLQQLASRTRSSAVSGLGEFDSRSLLFNAFQRKRVSRFARDARRVSRKVLRGFSQKVLLNCFLKNNL